MQNVTVCVIMQPTYIPWLGYFDLIDQADVFVLLDDVQLARRSWQVRNRIRRSDGEELMLSIPIRKTAHRDELILSDARVNDHTGWRRKHLASLHGSYTSTPFGSSAVAIWDACLASENDSLTDLHADAISRVMRVLGLDVDFIRASNLAARGSRDDRLLSICRAIDAKHYLSALGSAAYISQNDPEGVFAETGIELSYQHYEHPQYDQAGLNFMPYLGIVDLIANVGPDAALDVIRSGRRRAYSPLQAQAKVSAE